MKRFLTLLLFLVYFVAKSQEFLLPANYSTQPLPTLKTTTSDTLQLPFFVDFSQSYQMNNFTDNYITIVNTSTPLPPSIGVAMFDALDNNGNYYATTYQQSLIADYLTSKPINLAYPATQNVYLSFKYIARGYLDAPEPQDSLVLQFYSPSLNKWETVWTADNTKTKSFQTVIIRINQTRFLQNGFRFRFYNYISMSPNTPNPSFVANCDFWFIDYIYINKNRNDNDTTFADIALQTPTKLKFDDYTELPYTHYKQKASQINHNVEIFFRNNDKKIRQIDSLNLIFKEVNNADFRKLFVGSFALVANNNSSFKRQNINFSLPTNIDVDSLIYEISTILKTDSYDSACNNQTKQIKKLSDYYSYDDGTPENAYGLYGEGSLYALVAQKYYTYQKSNIIGVDVYFNKPFGNHLPSYFQPVVWSIGKNGMPDKILYIEKIPFEININKLNQFQRFIFAESVEVSDTFFIGWKKISEELENVGLDINSTQRNYKFVMISNGIWQQSLFGGVLMLRPVFGVAKTNNQKQAQIKSYPNPAKDVIYIYDLEISSNIKIFDLSGNLVLTTKAETENVQIDISSLKPGVYILQTTNNLESLSKKIVKQ